ncbi:21 kDa protein [Prunus yedoensis var. nudiflora]|uniref:21 kDa protein n=1 Tax=Prunus yedoensis var. nudiflora TaxID=2094558 RepID=A0A314ZMN8_PRUYE|nr:21 kDa protein [Prunus yedoensis var. nudiflora]
MEGYLMPALLLALHILQLFNHINPSTATGKTNTQYIKRSCSVTTYPRLCYHSLSIYAGKIKTNPKVLAHTALNVSLAATQEPIETAAALDCMEEIGDAIDELQQSLDELAM